MSTRVRLDPQQRRDQLLDLGVQLLSDCGLEELSIDLLAERAGISRGLLYHYFSNKRDFKLAVLRRMSARVIESTAPRGVGTPMEQMLAALEAYVDFVAENHDGYLAFVRSAAGGDASYQEIYETSRHILTTRIFDPPYAPFLASVGLRDDRALAPDRAGLVSAGRGDGARLARGTRSDVPRGAARDPHRSPAGAGQGIALLTRLA